MAGVLCLLSADAFAAFGGLVPLSWSGQLAYNYGYVNSAGNESETTSLMLGVDAAGYIWKPWFATTSMALNLGLSNTETSASSSDSVVGTGSFSLGVFPGSRFPFSLTYAQTDSRSQSVQSFSESSGDVSFHVTRLSLRQSYRPRAYRQLYNAWYYLTEFEGDNFGSESTTYGLEYSLRLTHQSFVVSGAHSSTRTQGGTVEPSVDSLSLNHVYTPSNELGVNSLVSYVEVDPGGTGTISQDSQAFSAFYWRPEHRAVNVSGGVRLSESVSEGTDTTTTRSLNTNLSVGYRITRALNFSAGASVGTFDSENAQTLSTSQTADMSYTGSRYQFAGYSYSWQWGGGVSNATTRTDTSLTSISTDRQSVRTGIGHNLSRSWQGGPSSSVTAGVSQAASGSKNSESDELSSTLNHGVNMSWNRRGQRGSVYFSTRAGDSRSYGERDAVFNDFGASVNADYEISRLSSVSGNMDFSASQSETENEAGGKEVSGNRTLGGGAAYRHQRPFGIYNLQFSSNLTGSKQIDSPQPSSTLRWESLFRYSLGLLTTSLTFRVSETPGGTVTKSMSFQATRSF
ncbi:MAG: hypothetical protein RRB22_06010 [Gammaproteobacteria bacterium]|nr:hypothetical protein [Gammaproteobacteria bacterium]